MTNAERVAAVGVALYGPGWAKSLARFAGINERTAQRIKAAARDGQDTDQALGVLVAIDAALAPVLDALE